MPDREDIPEDILDEEFSEDYCNDHFGYYGLFATLPIRAAILRDDSYDFRGFRRAPKSTMIRYIAEFDFDNQEFFTVDELRFLFQLAGTVLPLTDEQLESDRLHILSESKDGGK